jgi:hypothetical protein
VGHDVALTVAIIVLVVVLSTGAALVTALRRRRKLFAGSARDDWERARRDLSYADQLQVRRATMRRRPVDHAALAPAQLAYSRYVQHVAERSPLRRRPVLAALCVIYGGNAVLQLVLAVTETDLRAVHLVCGAGFAALTVTYGPLISRSLVEQPRRMRRLRALVRERYPEDWALKAA